MKFIKHAFLLILCITVYHSNIIALENKKNSIEDKKNSSVYSGLKFRSIGPALMSGRISDIVIHPENENLWYVTAGSGGVWKTENSGTTWKSIFDDQKSYSIGCISLDPQNPNIIWVGTGENVGGRHVAYGDGIYKSEDGGESWKNMGLKKSEHISKVIIHPKNSDILWVASQGPLWNKGGERGVYKSTDGGKSWTQTLGDNEWIGATDLIIDPRNPNLLYAATWQRHRTVAGYLGGGPGSAIYKSNDGGVNWIKLNNGLPTSNMGKIGLVLSPQNPDVIYAAIELDRRTGAVYKSTNKGSKWIKMSDAVSGGTGPHYYQELYASPHNFDELYLADNYMQVSYDGGKTFSRMNESEKHVDNHAIAFKKTDKNYLLVGCDGGLYESFDKTKNWKFIDNLPLTQFYKIAVDDDEPFYNIYGGTQDNNTQGAPSRTDNIHGIRNSDWFIILGGDGHQPATEPGNPNIVYAQWQRGNLNRHDRKTGENTNIKPQPEFGEKTERFNWDAPILVSPHNPKRLYFASQRVWKSNDRGDSWETISEDLTNNINRMSTPFYGSKQKWNNAWDVRAMSNYSTITSISESPIEEGLIYVGTDDGNIQLTENGGKSWRKINFQKMIDLPETAFVNDIKADIHDKNTVYAVFDNHKFGDFNPYIYMSKNKGSTWKKISSNLPENTLLWRVVQDHINSNLLFLGTEFGLYFSNNKGKEWIKLDGGMPNISVRDIAIQKRENDLVLATFGRGIYILDDYTALRTFNNKEEKSKLFSVRDGYCYNQKRILGGSKKASQGDNYFVAENPPFGVEFTYYLNEKILSKKEIREKKEKKTEAEQGIISIPDWETLETEKKEIYPQIWMFIYSENYIIKKIKAKNSKGFNRVSWNLLTESKSIISSKNLNEEKKGYMVSPGKYSAQLFKQVEGEFISISEKIFFNVRQLTESSIKGSSISIISEFKDDLYNSNENANNLLENIKDLKTKIDIMLKAYERATSLDKNLHSSLLNNRIKILDLEKKFGGSQVRKEIGEENEYPTIWSYIWSASNGAYTTYGPTKSHKKYLEIANKMLLDIEINYKKIENTIKPLEVQLKKINAPKIKE
ncbi:MAG: glycosyl hydrolase [Flavobacteriales bacterium]|nr:glycosyl hydrolase [Flavobacteriales bacterium]|tara:strand:+ start:230 stop:3484 length:3255 start_codon:yes stop_codon:yes gene_type:complete